MDGEQSISLERLEEMTSGDTEFLQEIIALYIEDAVDILSELKQHLQQSEPEGLRTAAHKLKGSSLNMGVGRVASLAQQIEQDSKGGVVDATMKTSVANIQQEFEIARKALEAHLSALN